MVAATAQHKPAQREIRMDILSRRRAGISFQPLLYFGERVVTNQRFVLGGLERNAPGWVTNMAGVKHPLQHFAKAGQMQATIGLLRKIRVDGQKILYLGQSFKPAARKSLERLLDDSSDGFVAHQYFTVARFALEAIADRLIKCPIAILHPRPHAVLHLLSVFLALVRGDAGQQMLDQPAVRIFAEFNRGRFELAARIADHGAQFDMCLQVPREAADIVDNHDMRFVFLVLLQKFQHRLHARAIGDRAGHAFFLKHRDDIIVFVLRVFATTRFL